MSTAVANLLALAGATSIMTGYVAAVLASWPSRRQEHAETVLIVGGIVLVWAALILWFASR